MTQQHIQIEVTECGVELLVDDYELFDFVDDFLTDHGLESAGYHERQRDGHIWFALTFDEETSPESLEEVVAKMPADEIEKIWRLNNP